MLDIKNGGKVRITSRENVPDKIKIMIGLLAVISLIAWAPDGFPDDDESDNLIALHDSSSPQYNKDCLECHESVLTGESLDPTIARAHVAMLPFAPGEDEEDKCVFCHRTVELVQGTPWPQEKSKSNLRKHVDSAVCTLCHGPSGPGQQFYEVDLTKLELDGAALYGLVCEGCHRELAESEVSGESAVEIRQNIAEDEGGMGPLNVLSDDQIQAIAGALAQTGSEDDE